MNPIGDMDINEIMEGELVNDMLRRRLSKIDKREPATWENYISHYIKTAQEHERNRHVFFLGYDDPHMDHGLFNGENDGIDVEALKDESEVKRIEEEH